MNFKRYINASKQREAKEKHERLMKNGLKSMEIIKNKCEKESSNLIEIERAFTNQRFER